MLMHENFFFVFFLFLLPPHSCLEHFCLQYGERYACFLHPSFISLFLFWFCVLPFYFLSQFLYFYYFAKQQHGSYEHESHNFLAVERILRVLFSCWFHVVLSEKYSWAMKKNESGSGLVFFVKSFVVLNYFIYVSPILIWKCYQVFLALVITKLHFIKSIFHTYKTTIFPLIQNLIVCHKTQIFFKHFISFVFLFYIESKRPPLIGVPNKKNFQTFEALFIYKVSQPQQKMWKKFKVFLNVLRISTNWIN